VIPGDISTEIASVLRAAVAAAEMPPAVAGVSAAGTWRPAPPQAGGGPGTYATSLPFALAQRTGRGAADLAAALAARLSGRAGIGQASVTGAGYLTVTVTDAALTGLAARVVAAGPACAASDALSGTRLSVPGHPDLAAAATWEQAWQWVADAVTGRLAEAAGAQVNFQIQAKRAAPPAPGPPPDQCAVAAAIAFAGAGRVRYALARTAAGGAGAMGRQLSVSNVLSDPFAAVCAAHADAASTLRWACDLGIRRGEPESLVAGPRTHRRERELLTAISWLPERVAGAARRRQPHQLAGYLEYLAGAWLDCRESCPALPFGGQSAPRDEAGMAARLWLADATRTALAAALGLLGVAAPGGSMERRGGDRAGAPACPARRDL
jgi:arginyl-tRNA synthetase